MLNPNLEAYVIGEDQLEAKTDYYTGNDKSRWLHGVSNFEKVRYRNIYNGIDATFGNAGQDLEYDFHVGPGADPGLIQLGFEGSRKVKINKKGDLVFYFKDFELYHQRPVAYQIIDGEKAYIDAKFVMLEKNKIGFTVGKYDRSRELVIDPVVYASYLGSAISGDWIADIDVDRQGNVYTASAAKFESVEGGFLTSRYHIQVIKFNPAGNVPIYIKIVSGSLDDVPEAMDVDDGGKVYVTGHTWSPNFPLHFAEQSDNGMHGTNPDEADQNAFVLRLHWDGDIQYSTYLGRTCAGDTENAGQSIVADSDGNAYVSGYTCSPNFTVRNAFQSSLNGTSNAFLVRYDDFGHITYSTYFGTGKVEGIDVYTTGGGIAYLAGRVYNGSVYTTPGAYNTNGAGYVAKFDTNAVGANSLRVSTRTPFPRYSIAVDSFGNAWTAGSQWTYKINRTGTDELLAIQYTGSGFDIAVDKFDNVYYENGTTAVVRDPDGDLTSESPSGAGGAVYGLAVGHDLGELWIAGLTRLNNFQTTPDAYQPSPNAPGNPFGQGFYVKVDLNVTDDREPIIFVPGVGGSTLSEATSDGTPIGDSTVWPNGIFHPISNSINKLSLDPTEEHPNIVAVDALEQVSIKKIYKPLLDRLRQKYIEYETNGNPKKRDVQCTGEETYDGEKPMLFVFAYDWRRSNTEAAAKLKQFVDCVQLFHPGKKVNILTHSMGGLVARRYILDHPNNHNIDRMVTMVPPFLGAPRAIDAPMSGRFLGDYGVYFYTGTLARMIPHFAGASELLPSRPYFDVGGRPFAYHSLLFGEQDYDYDETVEFMNERFPSRPYDKSALFHDYQSAAQDNWSQDSSGIKFLHIYGVQAWNMTVSKVVVKPESWMPVNPQWQEYGITRKRGKGDGTVPELSALRSASMLAPNTIVKRCASSSFFRDGSYEHNGITTNPIMWEEIEAFMDENDADHPECRTVASNLAESTTEVVENVDVTSLKVSGIDRLQITDEFGNTNSTVGSGGEQEVPGVSYEYGSGANDAVLVPHELIFARGKPLDVKFVVPARKIKIELFQETNAEVMTGAVKYMDLQMPPGVTALLQFTTAGVENLRYDSDGDGIFETTVQPTFVLDAVGASDTTPPAVDISASVVDNSVVLAVSATDTESGVRQVRYAFNGETSDHVYTGPITSQGQLIYVVAEDNSGNRELRAKWIDLSPPVTTVNQTPPANAAGWNTSDITLELKAMDAVDGSGVSELDLSGSGAQPVATEILRRANPSMTFPTPSTSAHFLAKSFTFFKEGVTTLSFNSKDFAGNVEPTRTHEVKIDKSLPITTHEVSTDGQQTMFTFSATDAVSGVNEILYSIDGGAAQTYATPVTVSNSGGHYVTYFARDNAGNEETPRRISVNPDLVPKSVLISEFRSRGPLGADDEFIELYNNGEVPVDISGWTVKAKHGTNTTPVVLATINAGTIVPPRGHYLLRRDGSGNYSLSGYAEADQTYSSSVGDNCGIALVSTSSVIVDAVGFASVTDATYREGTGLTPSAGITAAGQYAFARNFVKGLPVDSNNNKADFVFVSVDGGTFNNFKSILGAPGPENLGSPIYQEGSVIVNQIDSEVTLAESPNRLYDYSNPTAQFPVGFLSVRYRLTNNSGGTIGQLRLRITGITTKNSALVFPQQALLRVINSADITVSSANGQTAISLKGLTLEVVSGATDGGQNSSMLLDLPGGGLAPGESLNVDLKTGIVSNGQYRLELRPEIIVMNP